MKTENISQRVILEILVQEVETLKKSNEIIKTIVPKIDTKINQIQDIKVNIDAADVDDFKTILSNYQEEFIRISKKQLKYLSLPNWLMITIFSLFLITTISVSLDFYYYNKFKKADEVVQYWYQKAVEFGYKNN